MASVRFMGTWFLFLYWACEEVLSTTSDSFRSYFPGKGGGGKRDGNTCCQSLVVGTLSLVASHNNCLENREIWGFLDFCFTLQGHFNGVTSGAWMPHGMRTFTQAFEGVTTTA